jgi:hypothetical protein
MNLAVSFFRLPQVVACFTKSFDVLILVPFKDDDHFERLFILNGDGCTASLWVGFMGYIFHKHNRFIIIPKHFSI